MSETYRFGDLVEKYIDNRGKTPPLSENGVPLLEVKHLPAEGKYPILQTSKHVSQDVYDTWFRAHLEAGDILFSTVGTTGRVSITPKNTKVAIAQNVLGLRFKSSLFDPAFAFYYLRSKPFQHEIESRLITTVQASIKRSDMVGIPMHLPEIPVQKCIASILGALDDKIENNRRMNETLVEMARTIFKSWFVDFDPVHAKAAGNAPAHMDAETAALFPSSFGDDGLPMGWRDIELNQLINVKHGYAFKGKFFSKTPTQKILLTPGNFKIGGGIKLDKLKYYNGEIPEDYLLLKDDLILTMTDLSKEGDTLGFPALVPSSEKLYFLHNQRIGKVEFKSDRVSKYFLYFFFQTKRYRNEIVGSASGSTVKHTSPSRIMAIKIPFSRLVQQAFGKRVEPLTILIANNEQQSETLAKLRDILLPKLMSGEIRAADAEREVEAAI